MAKGKPRIQGDSKSGAEYDEWNYLEKSDKTNSGKFQDDELYNLYVLLLR
jgi:hypothetical protein